MNIELQCLKAEIKRCMLWLGISGILNSSSHGQEEENKLGSIGVQASLDVGKFLMKKKAWPKLQSR